MLSCSIGGMLAHGCLFKHDTCHRVHSCPRLCSQFHILCLAFYFHSLTSCSALNTNRKEWGRGNSKASFPQVWLPFKQSQVDSGKRPSIIKQWESVWRTYRVFLLVFFFWSSLLAYFIALTCWKNLWCEHKMVASNSTRITKSTFGRYHIILPWQSLLA